jgi:hypothetical protein
MLKVDIQIMIKVRYLDNQSIFMNLTEVIYQIFPIIIYLFQINKWKEKNYF